MNGDTNRNDDFCGDGAGPPGRETTDAGAADEVPPSRGAAMLEDAIRFAGG